MCIELLDGVAGSADIEKFGGGAVFLWIKHVGTVLEVSNVSQACSGSSYHSGQNLYTTSPRLLSVSLGAGESAVDILKMVLSLWWGVGVQTCLWVVGVTVRRSIREGSCERCDRVSGRCDFRHLLCSNEQGVTLDKHVLYERCD